jgi:hypothetical protein
MTSREQKAMLAITIHAACVDDAKDEAQHTLRCYAGLVMALMRAEDKP